MNMAELSGDGISVSLDIQKGAITIFNKGKVSFGQIGCSDYLIKNVLVEENKIFFSIYIDKDREVSAVISISDDFVSLDLTGDFPIDDDSGVKYPPAFDAQKGDIGIFAYGEGCALPLDDKNISFKPERIMFSGTDSSMGFWGQLRGESWLLAVVETHNDACLLADRGEDGFLRTSVKWIGEKGEFSYCRKMRFYIGESGGISALAKKYREYIESKRSLDTLCEKARRNPTLDKFLGSANVWLWNDGGLESLYAKDAQIHEITEDMLELRRKIASEMKHMGMKRVLWNDFEEVDRETVEYIKNLGYTVGYYGIYQDVIPKPVEHLMTPVRRSRCKLTDNWPDDIIITKDGEYQECWYLTGTDGNQYFQNAMCDIPIVKCAMEDIPPFIEKMGYNARFVDGEAGASLKECYCERHPMTRTDCLRYRNILLRYVKDLGLVCGAECMTEDMIDSVDYNEGNMSPGWFRAPDSGRKMTTLYFGDEIPERITDYMLNPVYRIPLFELIYHDCVVSYWYWGDSQVCCPELIKKRDLLNALYGTPPLYSLNVSQWNDMKNEVAESYKRASEVSFLTKYSKMTEFDYITSDKLVQRTVFDNGIEVIANFSNEKIEYLGRIIEPEDKVIIDNRDVKQ